MNRGLHSVAHKLIFVHYVNEIYGNFSQPERQPGQKLFSQGIWPGAPWCSAAADYAAHCLACSAFMEGEQLMPVSVGAERAGDNGRWTVMPC